MRAKDIIPASKPRNFVAKNSKTAGAGAHKDKKRAEKLVRDVKHKKDSIPTEGWSQKYKSSINCSEPKGFSQKAHCAGKKKNDG